MGNLVCRDYGSEQNKPQSWKDHGVSLQRNLVREQHRDFHEVYHVEGIIGEGSISNIYKIKKRKSVIGRSSFSKKRGSTGKTRRDKKRTVSGQVYALKEIDTAGVKEGYMEELFNEVALLRQLDHPHIVKLYETYFHRRKLSIVIELCTGGDLYKRNP
jgi:calcium-dependent protein kinase